MMAEALNHIQCDSPSPRQVVLRRLASLEGDGAGLASPLVKILTLAIDRVVASNDDGAQPSAPPKWSWDGVRELKRMLQIHFTLSSTDSDLAEEMAREGSHVQLARLLRMELPTFTRVGPEADDNEAESYHDALVEIQDIAGEIASRSHHFPIPFSPFTHEELRHRLPLIFCFDSNCRRRFVSDSALGITPCCSAAVLIHQVTIRQSSQRDVGFVTWPSAVALSQWIVTNPTICEKSNRILEIGAGCGLAGIVAACFPQFRNSQGSAQGRHRTNSQVVTLTDFNPLVLRNIERNIALNGISKSCRVVGLDFNDQAAVVPSSGWKDMNGVVHDPVDLVLGADIVCQPEDAHGAAVLIRNALRPAGKAVVVCADATARFGVDHLLPACQKLGLRVHVTPVTHSGNGDAPRNIFNTSGYVDGMKLNMFQIARS